MYKNVFVVGLIGFSILIVTLFYSENQIREARLVELKWTRTLILQKCHKTSISLGIFGWHQDDNEKICRWIWYDSLTEKGTNSPAHWPSVDNSTRDIRIAFRTEFYQGTFESMQSVDVKWFYSGSENSIYEGYLSKMMANQTIHSVKVTFGKIYDH